jgi:hypothetical protein
MLHISSILIRVPDNDPTPTNHTLCAHSGTCKPLLGLGYPLRGEIYREHKEGES